MNFMNQKINLKPGDLIQYWDWSIMSFKEAIVKENTKHFIITIDNKYIDWEELSEIYTPENNPEYFLQGKKMCEQKKELKSAIKLMQKMLEIETKELCMDELKVLAVLLKKLKKKVKKLEEIKQD